MKILYDDCLKAIRDNKCSECNDFYQCSVCDYIQQRYQQGIEDERPKAFAKGYDSGYKNGRADELDKIYKMMLLGCGELKCDECDYRFYSQDVCQQAFTFGMINDYIVEQLKEQKNAKSEK